MKKDYTEQARAILADFAWSAHAEQLVPALLAFAALVRSEALEECEECVSLEASRGSYRLIDRVLDKIRALKGEG